jgi:hypothetical protein
MATTTNYLQGMKTALNIAAAQKKAALQNALNAATTTTFKSDGTFKGNINAFRENTASWNALVSVLADQAQPLVAS